MFFHGEIRKISGNLLKKSALTGALNFDIEKSKEQYSKQDVTLPNKKIFNIYIYRHKKRNCYFPYWECSLTQATHNHSWAIDFGAIREFCKRHFFTRHDSYLLIQVYHYVLIL